MHVLIKSNGQVYYLLRLFLSLGRLFFNLFLVPGLLVEVDQVGTPGNRAQGYKHLWKLVWSLRHVHGQFKSVLFGDGLRLRDLLVQFRKVKW